MYASKDRLIIIDADGTIIDAFTAIELAFARHGMDIGDLDRFQKRRNLFKYLGGIKEFPSNLAKHLGRHSRKALLGTLTEVYREQASLYAGMTEFLQILIGTSNIRVGIVTRNITVEPERTLTRLFSRHGIDIRSLDFLHLVPLSEKKTAYFRKARERFDVNPARAYACGDEHKDYLAAQACGIQPFVVSYGFESHARLTDKFNIPDVVIAKTPEDLIGRVRHALDLEQRP
jgi:phosphoglycolate phosphatase